MIELAVEEEKAMPKHRTPNLECGILVPLSVLFDDRADRGGSVEENAMPKHRTPDLECGILVPLSVLFDDRADQGGSVEEKAMPKHRTPNFGVRHFGAAFSSF